MIITIISNIFIAVISAFIALNLQKQYIKKQLNKFHEEQQKRADSVRDWFKNDLKTDITDEKYADMLAKSINHLYVTLYDDKGLLNLAKYISNKDTLDIIHKLEVIHKNYIKYRETNFIKLYGMLKSNEKNLQNDTKQALNLFTLNEKQNILILTEQFENIIQVLMSTLNRKENND